MKVILGVSNRHVHLTEEDYKVLFGDEPLGKVKDLVQPGQFASDKKVSLKTEKRTIDGVRLLGPLRKYTQVEISKTDSFSLGIDPPIRNSGDLEGASVITIVGPKGEITKPCCIIANRHLHISPEERRQYNLVGVDKVNPSFTLEFHIDTDDGNGSLAKTGEEVEIIIP